MGVFDNPNYTGPAFFSKPRKNKKENEGKDNKQSGFTSTSSQGPQTPEEKPNSPSFEESLKVKTPTVTETPQFRALLDKLFSEMGIDKRLIDNPKSREVLKNELDIIVEQLSHAGLFDVSGVHISHTTETATDMHFNLIKSELLNGQNQWQIFPQSEGQEAKVVFPTRQSTRETTKSTKYIKVAEEQYVIVGEDKHNFFVSKDDNKLTDYHCYFEHKYDNTGKELSFTHNSKGLLNGEKISETPEDLDPAEVSMN